MFKGQLSGWAGYSSGAELPLIIGGRYLPQLNLEVNGGTVRHDFEVAANLSGNGTMEPFRQSEWSGNLKLYRGWARISTDNAEIRIGLQKINFGSATLLRPLMWFDRIDPRDPLQLTDGVWGALGRYYFSNNTNIWLWGLYGNTEQRPWELGSTSEGVPEYGGRIQFALPKGEAALSFHHRKAETASMISLLQQNDPSTTVTPNVRENRIGFDVKLDLSVGLWIEASWTGKRADFDIYTNQELITVGTDYTFGIGNGLNVVFEHLLFSYDQNPLQFKNTGNLSALSASYPLGLFDNISYMSFYEWKSGGLYNFVNWRHTFKKTELYVMGYINPEQQLMTGGGLTSSSRFTGKGIQVMLVFNHQLKK
ncbi:MAG: hypothetical protein A2X18_01980 [Bacteroidetes bacterium GWF2_40_14]|nr:MAG: hypothetical protein A2X18_01980 [Bacteroidetes bacterium GWF2_40_14]